MRHVDRTNKFPENSHFASLRQLLGLSKTSRACPEPALSLLRVRAFVRFRACPLKTMSGPKSREPRFMRQGHCAGRHYSTRLGSKVENVHGDGDIETPILANFGRLEPSFGEAVFAALPISAMATINSTQWKSSGLVFVCIAAWSHSANSICVPPL